MRLRLVIFMSATVLMLAFQNCGKSFSSKVSDASSTSVSGTEVKGGFRSG